AAGREERSPYLAAGSVQNQTLITCACDLVSPHWPGWRRRADSKCDENSNDNSEQRAFDVDFCIHSEFEVSVLGQRGLVRCARKLSQTPPPPGADLTLS